MRWTSPKFKQGKYKKLIVDNVVFYPGAKPTKQISKEVLIEMREYTNKAVRREVGKVVPITSQPGPNVLRLRTAMTGVATSAKEMAGYEYIPVAAIVAGVTTATGARDREAFIMLEAEVLDSMTGERLIMAVRKRKGKNLLENDKQKLTLDTVQDIIDDTAVNLRKFIESHKAKIN